MASKSLEEKFMNSSPEMDEFMQGPLVSWFQSCLSSPDRLSSFEDLTDGVLIHEVILLIQPEPEHKGLVVPSYKDPLIRIRNMAANIKNVQSIYENDLFQTILVCPDPVALAGTEESAEEKSLAAMKLMLLLLLGAAVQGPSKEAFIEAIKQLPLNCQHSIVECIKQVTNSQQLVLTQDWGEIISSQGSENILPDFLASHVMRLAKERDAYLIKWTSSLLGESGGHANESNSRIIASPRASNGGKEEESCREKLRSTGHHGTVAITVEVSEWKARVRRLRQELEERTEALAECREESERFHNETVVLRRRVQDLTEEARAGAAYRDEVDALRERAEQADRLEAEIRRYKERLGDTEFYRTRVEELREDNRVLLETKELLEEQLSVARRRAERTLQVESDLERARREIEDLKMECDAGRERAVDLSEEVARLQLQTSAQWRRALRNEHMAKGDNSGAATEDYEDEDGGGMENRSLSEQLTSQAEARALKLELENSRLIAELEAKKQELGGEIAAQMSTLQGENKRLTMKIEQLQEDSGRWSSERGELEAGLQEALMERRRLQNSLDSIKEVNRGHMEEKQMLQGKLEERNSSLRKSRSENQRLSEEIRKYQAEEDRRTEEIQKARDQVTNLQKEVTALLREISQLKEDLEAKEVSMNQLVCQGEAREEERQFMLIKQEEMQAQIKRLQDIERDMAECQRKALEDHDSLATLQGDLIQEKTKRQILHGLLSKVEDAFVKIGVELPWDLASIDNETSVDPDLVVERIKNSVEIHRIVREIIQLEESEKLQSASDDGQMEAVTEHAAPPETISDPLIEKIKSLEEEVSSLQSELKMEKEKQRKAVKEGVAAGVDKEVEIATLHSRIQSLTDQHTALHLANSQLVAEKDEMARELEREQSMGKELLHSQEVMKRLYNELTLDYERVALERDTARMETRAAKADAEHNNKMVANLKEKLQEQRNEAFATSTTLANLRLEHSKLKDDMKLFYSIIEQKDDEIKDLKSKLRSSMNIHHLMSRGGPEGLEERASRRESAPGGISDETRRLTSENSILREMNAQLIEERRALMSHATKLLNECHGLFTNSSDDRNHYHQEEKAHVDEVYDLQRQKEKLEEKIMELYRSIERSTSKKKGFGANFVKKCRKAGSDLISIVPRKGGRSWHREGRRSLSHSNVQLMSDVASGGSGGDDAEDDDVNRRDEEGSSGNGDWDTSAPVAADTDVLLPPATSLRLAGAGSRQGVYYTSNAEKQPKGDENDQIPEQDSRLSGGDDAGPRSAQGLNQSEKANLKGHPAGSVSKSPPQPSDRYLLVHNRITANISTGGTYKEQPSSSPCPGQQRRSMPLTPNDSPVPHSDDKEIWLEFGCV